MAQLPPLIRCRDRAWLRMRQDVYVTAEAPVIAAAALTFAVWFVATGSALAGVAALFAFGIVGLVTDFGQVKLSYPEVYTHG